jgi:hypothetical protein
MTVNDNHVQEIGYSFRATFTVLEQQSVQPYNA